MIPVAHPCSHPGAYSCGTVADFHRASHLPRVESFIRRGASNVNQHLLTTFGWRRRWLFLKRRPATPNAQRLGRSRATSRCFVSVSPPSCSSHPSTSRSRYDANDCVHSIETSSSSHSDTLTTSGCL